ncbi:MAG TPA: L,D-transpeptidase [Armatimonadota bacterium]|nr:L,D-transpeptidase [Armatimonadota bacterium]HOM81639.1 L,D-transpeptidase [Armatimonadota bacterium]HOQ28896.1 L,D-transpeptidase [Armatimonadota bacterium]HPO71482.1 L,D-transpeptidase [Armatimonadota bacterium]HPT96413.1 L,D-transpeptidase [Armatimonadota bacterium]
MIRKALVIAVLLAWPALGHAQSLSITGPARSGLLEGELYRITWKATGLKGISVVATGERTPLGTNSRGTFTTIIAESAPASRGTAPWRVPWIDAVELTIKVKGYDARGQLVATDMRRYHFRPAVMAHRMKNGIYLDLHLPRRQRLYVQRDGRITHAFLSSSSARYSWQPRNRHPAAPHDHAGVYRVLEKRKMHWSQLFDVPMPYAIRYHGGHFIHATSRNLYAHLGRPASAGCNRLTRHDASLLYQMTPIGTRVEVIGPGG